MARSNNLKAVNIHTVANNTINITRKEIIAWITSVMQTDLKRVEDLGNGSIYCRIMDKIFPGSIPMNRVKGRTRTDTEAFGNYKLLLNAFKAHDVRKDIPVDSLLKGLFSENFRFAQWFKLFYEANVNKMDLTAYHPNRSGDAALTKSFQRIISSPPPRRSNSVNGRISTESPTIFNVTSMINNHHQRRFERPGSIPPDYNMSSNANTTWIRTLDTSRKITGSDELKLTPEHSEEDVEDMYESPLPLQKDATSVVNLKNVTKCNTKPYHSTENEKFGHPFRLTNGPEFMPSGRNNSKTDPRPKRRNSSCKKPAGIGITLPPPSPSSFNGVAQHVSTAQRLLKRNINVNSSAEREIDRQSTNTIVHSEEVNLDSCQAGTGSILVDQTLAERTREQELPQQIHHISGLTNEINPKLHSGRQQFYQAPHQDKHSAQTNVSSQLVFDQVNLNTPGQPVSDCIPMTQVSYNVLHSQSGGNLHLCSVPVQSYTPSYHRDPTLYQHNSAPSEVEPRNVASIEQVNDLGLQQEVIRLRSESLMQRRSLYFCQKEASFYFNKLRMIESFCVQLNQTDKKPLSCLLETLFQILYETEEGFASPEDAEVCV